MKKMLVCIALLFVLSVSAFAEKKDVVEFLQLYQKGVDTLVSVGNTQCDNSVRGSLFPSPMLAQDPETNAVTATLSFSNGMITVDTSAMKLEMVEMNYDMGLNGSEGDLCELWSLYTALECNALEADLKGYVNALGDYSPDVIALSARILNGLNNGNGEYVNVYNGKNYSYFLHTTVSNSELGDYRFYSIVAVAK